MQPHRLTPVLLATVLLSQFGCTTPSLFRHDRPTHIDRRSAAIIPTGMRRTKNGWEDASTWFVADHPRRSLDSWLHEHRQREAGHVQRVLEEIRTTPPLMVALVQIAAIAVIFRVSRDPSTDSQ